MKTLFLSLLSLLPVCCLSQLSLDVESGAATFGYNDVRIPGEGGTNFSLKDDFGTRTFGFFRARLNYTIGGRHTISLLYAPLSVRNDGEFANDVVFRGTVFSAGQPVSSTWKFNSYRLSYQYSFIQRKKLVLAAGLTGKIRDAKIALRGEGVAASKTNTGFVPLVRLYGDWSMTEKLHLILDADALASKQGRAEDISLALAFNVLEKLKVKLGYRLLEGGADNDEVYNFSAVHYAAAGLIATF